MIEKLQVNKSVPDTRMDEDQNNILNLSNKINELVEAVNRLEQESQPMRTDW